MVENKTVKFFRGLNGKTIISVTLLITVISIILGLFFTSKQKQSMEEGLVKRFTALTKNLAYNAQYGVLTGYRSEINRLIQGIMKENEIIYILITEEDGSILGCNDTTLIGRKYYSILKDTPAEIKAFTINKKIDKKNKMILLLYKP